MEAKKGNKEMNKFVITAFTYEDENPLTKFKVYDKKPTKEDVEEFFVEFTNHNEKGDVTQEDIDFVRYNLLKFGYVKFAEKYCFNLIDFIEDK
jgi:hypothetical protein